MIRISTRYIRRVVLALALGGLTTWIVAWGCALLESHSMIIHGGLFPAGMFPHHQIRTEDGDIGLIGSSEMGCSDVFTCPRWTIHDPAAFDPYYPTPEHVELAERKRFGESPWAVPSWAIIPRAADTTLLHNATHAYGWPARAAVWLQENRLSPEGSPHRMFGTFRFGLFVVIPFTGGGEGVMPLKPIPTGMVVDVLFFGVCWWLLFVGCGAARRILRRRRGHCVKCVYDLRGLPPGSSCPECGGAPPAPRL